MSTSLAYRLICSRCSSDGVHQQRATMYSSAAGHSVIDAPDGWQQVTIGQDHLLLCTRCTAALQRWVEENGEYAP
jgi:hypothetical protein